MSAALISFLFALGASTWIYTKVMKSSGGLTQNSLIVAGVSGLLIFFISLGVLSLLI